jgi:hypothetical protein
VTRVFPQLAASALALATLSLVAACLFTLACSRAPKEAPRAEDAGARPSAAASPSIRPAPPPLAKTEVVTLMEGLALLHAEHMKDCVRLTTELERFEASRAGDLVRAAPDAFAAIEADPSLSERLGRAMETIMTVSMACANEPRFAALHARRQGKPASEAPSSSSVASATAPAPNAPH